MTQTGVRGYGLRAQDTISDQKLMKECINRLASRKYSSSTIQEIIVFWKIKLKLKFGNIKKTMQFIMISYSDCFKINENTN